MADQERTPTEVDELVRQAQQLHSSILATSFGSDERAELEQRKRSVTSTLLAMIVREMKALTKSEGPPRWYKGTEREIRELERETYHDPGRTLRLNQLKASLKRDVECFPDTVGRYVHLQKEREKAETALHLARKELPTPGVVGRDFASLAKSSTLEPYWPAARWTM
ncbi:hypothetical protein JCM8547_005157 [Rhodosporidiobolus lusitaniae]